MFAGALRYAVAVAVLLLSMGVGAQESGPRFAVHRFDVTGNTLLPAAEVEAALAPFAGEGRAFGDIRQAAQFLEREYRQRGYGLVQVRIPPQDVTAGVVRLQVIEPRVGKVVIEGNENFAAENIRRSLPAVREGEAPNTEEIAQELQLAAEHPAKRTVLLLRPGANESTVDVGIRVADEKPWRAFLTLDNTGSGATGYYRTGIGYQHSNLFDRDHTLTAQYVTSPTHPSKVSIYGAGYRVPFYGLHSSLDLIAGYSNVDSGTVQDVFTVSGQGGVAAARWNYYPARWDAVEQRLSLGLDYRVYNNQVEFEGQGLVPDITVHPASATYHGVVRDAQSELTFNAGLAANIPGGNDGGSADFERSRAGATSRYAILRYGFSYLRTLPGGWQGRALFNGQYTQDALVSGEQFGLGGPDSVRGYPLREVVNDRGYAGQLELFTPELAAPLGLPDSYQARLSAFYDFGLVRRNRALPGEARGDSISSAGIAARAGYGKALSVRLDFARILQSTPNRRTGSVRLGLAAAYQY